MSEGNLCYIIIKPSVDIRQRQTGSDPGGQTLMNPAGSLSVTMMSYISTPAVMFFS